jgi:ATP-dependent helicase/nuclease subunit A
VLAGLPLRGHDEPSVYAYLNAVNEERTAFETQRLLYVAATRAKHRLHVLGKYRHNVKADTVSAPRGTFMHLLLPAFLDQIKATPEEAGAEGESKGVPQPLPLLRLVNPPPLPTGLRAATGPELDAEPHSTPDSEPARLRPLPAQEAAALGEALHRWLELIHDHWEQGWTAQWLEQHPEALASTLKRGGVKENRITELLPVLTAMLMNAVGTESSRALLSPEGKHGSWSELVLYKREGTGISRHVIDRMYQDQDGKLVIVDYKSGEDSPATRQKWVEQLARYRALIDGLDSGEVSGTLIYQVGDNSVIDLSSETGLPG